MTTEDQPFIDYYDLLQVHPACDSKALESAYHDLAKLHHPDHTGVADTTRFNEVIQAYKALRNPEKRAKYDRLYLKHKPGASTGFHIRDDAQIEEQAALDDADAHERILVFLYKKRREDSQNAGVIGFYLQELVKCSHEHFEFHKWYLKEKGYIITTEHGTLAITIEGVDHVISRSRTTLAERLLIAKPGDGQDRG